MNADRIAFGSIRFMHETLYSLFRDANQTLHDAGLKPGLAVLEVGCGPGFFTLPAARIVGDSGSVCAVDLNRCAVAHVQRKVARAGASNVEVKQLDATDTGFPPGQFDLAFLFGFRRAVGGMNAVLKEMHRVLRADGLLATEGPLVAESDPAFRLKTRKGRILVYERLSSGSG